MGRGRGDLFVVYSGAVVSRTGSQLPTGVNVSHDLLPCQALGTLMYGFPRECMKVGRGEVTYLSCVRDLSMTLV